MNIHIAYICCHELPRSSPSCCFAQAWGEGRVDNAIPPIFPRQWYVFSVVSPRNSLSAMFIYFTVPIINFEIATLATNDMWPNSQFSMSGLAGLRAAAFIFTFTHWESKWGEWVVICSWDTRDLWPATHQISILFYYRKKTDRNCMKCIKTHVSMHWYAFRCISDIRQI